MIKVHGFRDRSTAVVLREMATDPQPDRFKGPATHVGWLIRATTQIPGMDDPHDSTDGLEMPSGTGELWRIVRDEDTRKFHRWKATDPNGDPIEVDAASMLPDPIDVGRFAGVTKWAGNAWFVTYALCPDE